MSTTLYVANLPSDASEDDIRQLFASYGEVQSVKLITDNESGKPAGYGFVEMDQASARTAVQNLADQEFMGNTLQVNQARGRSDNRDA